MVLTVASSIVACSTDAPAGPGNLNPPPIPPPTATSIVVAGGDEQTAETGSVVPTAPEVRLTAASGVGVAGVRVQFAVTSGGGSVQNATVTTNTSGVASAGTWTLGSTGPQALRATASGVGSVDFTATATAPPPVATAIAATAGNGQTATTSTSVGTPPSVRVTDGNGDGMAGVSVTFAVTAGGGAVSSAVRSTNSSGVATVGSWTLGASAGTNTLTATASGSGIAGNPISFNATATAGGGGGGGGGSGSAFDIEIRYNPGSSPTSAQGSAFSQAESQWESVITGDLANTLVNRAAGTCSSPNAINETVDDLIIFVTLEAIDGVGGTLGSAGPCVIRSGSLLPLIGQMRLDIADLANMEANGSLSKVIAHEVGHVLGVGSLWSALGVLADPMPSTPPPPPLPDPHFTGPLATAAFNTLGGSGYSGAKVPVEDTGSSGTINSHWRETVFAKELMTGWINSGLNPLSLVTVQSMSDLGYSVNTGAAQSYSLPGSSLLVPAPGAARFSLQMIDDVWIVPLEIVAPDGAHIGLIVR